ncbi:MAG: G-D-S-L family lipolytic protein [Planctomycetes bacterium]|nr:G-D-S-L family lipolytic protein [Planctomycetota bacterium]
MSKKRFYTLLGTLAIAMLLSIQTVPQIASGQAVKTTSVPASLPAAGAYHLPAAFKLVCIGDSITQGGVMRQTGKTYTSYRYPLWKMFVDENIQVDFIGSMTVSQFLGFQGDDYKGKKFDCDHEGHGGWTTAAIAEKLPEWIEKYTPDAAMIQLGTNDMSKTKEIEPTIQAMTGIIETLRKKNPKVLILLGQTFQEGGSFPAMRKAMVELAEKLTKAESPIVIVDYTKGWVCKPDAKDTCTIDWVHCNERGAEIMAKKWFEVIKPFLTK